jgi:DNA-binding transcriptional MerR regulator
VSDENWTSREVAVFLRCSPDTVNELRKRKLLAPAGRTSPNGRWLYSSAEVRAYARRCATLPAATLIDDVAAMIDAAVSKERSA